VVITQLCFRVWLSAVVRPCVFSALVAFTLNLKLFWSAMEDLVKKLVFPVSTLVLLGLAGCGTIVGKGKAPAPAPAPIVTKG
jgi:hypothetical protein